MFTGFTQDAVDFLSDIRFHNNQQFFEENRQRYEEKVKAPLRALSDELAPIVQMIDPKLDVRPGRTMSRIRRDTRFSRDKSPFRDHAWLGWRYPGEARSEGFGLYWGFGPGWMVWGCGCYAADKPLMDALRLHIRRHPDEVRAALRQKGLDGRFSIYGEDYKKIAVPGDVPDDLRALYIKKGFGIEHVGDAQDWQIFRTRELADVLSADLAAMGPLHQLMQRMRREAEHARQETARIQGQGPAKGAKSAAAGEALTVHDAEEFEF